MLSLSKWNTIFFVLEDPFNAALHWTGLHTDTLFATLYYEQLGAPQSVATDAAGRVLMVDGSDGVNATLVFR